MDTHRPAQFQSAAEYTAAHAATAAGTAHRSADAAAPACADGSDDRLPLFEIRPDAATFWRGVGTRAMIFLPLFAVAVYRSTRQGIGASFLLYCGLALLLAFAASIVLQTSSLVLTRTTVEKHRRWLPPRVVQRAAVASGVLVPLYRSAFNRTAGLLVLAGPNGRPLLRLTGQIYTAADLDTLARRMGYDLFDVFGTVAGPKDVARRHPKLIPLVERRPALVVVLGTVALLVGVVVGVSLLDPAV